jgi:hypothetical protein
MIREVVANSLGKNARAKLSVHPLAANSKVTSASQNRRLCVL